MKIPIIYFLFLLISFVIYSQEREAIILFNDNTSIKGFGEIKKEKIYFKVSLAGKTSEWSHDFAKGILFSGYGFSEKYIYIKPDKYSKPVLMEVIEEGNMNLYRESNYGLSIGMELFVKASEATVGPKLDYDYSSKYYVKRENEENATDLSFRFKTISLRYFSDCEDILEKIRNKDFKVKTIPELVFYYNDYCGKENEY
jgi:hypothetical protein